MKKKLSVILITLISAFLLCSCEPTQLNGTGTQFIPLSQDGDILIYYHAETGVCYAVLCADAAGRAYTSGITVMLKEDGTPYTVEDYRENVYEMEDK